MATAFRSLPCLEISVQPAFKRFRVRGLSASRRNAQHQAFCPAASDRDLDGFVLDVTVVRPYYVVVHAGKWFASKYFLLPIGHIAFDSVARRLVADVSRDRMAGYPGFDRDEWATISDEEIARFDQAMTSIGVPTDPPGTSAMDRTPTWWDPGR
jgi:hypothetical protein